MSGIKIVVGALLMSLVGGSAVAAAAQSPQVVEKARVPERDGAERVALLKSGKKLETVTCRDFVLLDESFRPQAVTYAANYGRKSKAHPTMTVSGVERIVPVVVDACNARPGDHFVATVHKAIMAKSRR